MAVESTRPLPVPQSSHAPLFLIQSQSSSLGAVAATSFLRGAAPSRTPSPALLLRYCVLLPGSSPR
uniref:Uncharacterized protein n=1 Tax=Arundo donax TaxID=35708 RepID=A0A0A8YE68_ARUDO